jgi:hypothetical protein
MTRKRSKSLSNLEVYSGEDWKGNGEIKGGLGKLAQAPLLGKEDKGEADLPIPRNRQFLEEVKFYGWLRPVCSRSAKQRSSWNVTPQ